MPSFLNPDAQVFCPNARVLNPIAQVFTPQVHVMNPPTPTFDGSLVANQNPPMLVPMQIGSGYFAPVDPTLMQRADNLDNLHHSIINNIEQINRQYALPSSPSMRFARIQQMPQTWLERIEALESNAYYINQAVHMLRSQIASNNHVSRT